MTQTHLSTAIEQFQTTVAGILNDLLDAYYQENPSSNAFGADYEALGQIPDGTYYLGRENGASGAENKVGFDYFYRRFRDPETRENESEYVFGSYGWMGVNDLVNECPLIEEVLAEAVDREYLDEQSLERFQTASDQLETDLREVRDSYTLEDLAELFYNHEIDLLRPLLGHGEEEGRVLWQILFSKDEDGNRIENPIEIPVVSETDQFMFIRTERYYYDQREHEGEHYPYGAVIGYDDTPQRFFVHRLESDSDLRDDDTEWTPSLVKEKMGFDANLYEVDSADLPFNRRIRVQGDLVIIREHYEEALQEFATKRVQQAEQTTAADHFDEAVDETDLSQITESDDLYVRSYSRISIAVRPDSTDELKQVQDTIGIDEETVRHEQEKRDWNRLTANRREQILEDILTDMVIDYCFKIADQHRSDVRETAQDEARAAFEDTTDQTNTVVGNHAVMGSAVREHPDTQLWDNDSEHEIVVPESGTTAVLHDEHENKGLELSPGRYKFAFLDGFEDEWWM